MDQAQIGVEFMKQVTMQEAEYTANRIEREKARSGEFYGYDPYHPNEYDVQKSSENEKSWFHAVWRMKRAGHLPCSEDIHSIFLW